MTKMMIPNTLQQNKGLEQIQKWIDKLVFILEEHPDQVQFTREEILPLYTTVYNMCCEKPPYDFALQLYTKFRDAFVVYIYSTVLPCLRNSQGELLLRELVKRWQNHKVMVFWLHKIFHYLDRYYVPRMALPTLDKVALTCFRDLVFQEMNGKVRDAAAALIDQEREEGRQIDRVLLKNVWDIFVEMGMGQIVSLEDSFKKLEIATDR